MTNAYLQSTTLAALAEYANDHVVAAVLSGENPATLDLGNLPAVVYNGILYSRRATARPADGVSVIADTNGTKFVAGTDVQPPRVNGARTAPPANPADGDAYIVNGAGTGAWSAGSNRIATWSAAYAEWVFQRPQEGLPIYNQAAKAHWYFDEAGNWQTGLAAGNITGVNPTQIQNLGAVTVLGLADFPPDLPAAGDLWIVGAAGGGAWAGQDHSLAYWNGTGWQFVAPRRGTAARDEADGVTRTWNGTAWEQAGIDNPIVGYEYVSLSPSAVTPAGAQVNNQKRVLWTYTIPAAATFCEVEFIDRSAALLDLSASRFLPGTAMPTLDAVLACGGTEVFRTPVQLAQRGLPANAVIAFANTQVGADNKRALINITDYANARDLEFSIQIGGTAQSLGRQFVQIRNVRGLEGTVQITSKKRV